MEQCRTIGRAIRDSAESLGFSVSVSGVGLFHDTVELLQVYVYVFVTRWRYWQDNSDSQVAGSSPGWMGTIA